MALKAILESIPDDFPEDLRGEYIERDGKFYLDLENDIRDHFSILPLANSLKNVKAEKIKLQQENADLRQKVEVLPENFDKDEYERLRTEEEKRKNDPKYAPNADERVQQAKEMYESRIRNMQSAHEQKLAETESVRAREVGERDRELEDILLDQRLSRALDEAGVSPQFKKAASAMLKPSGKVLRDEETGKRRAIIETDLGEEEIGRFVENWTRSDEGRHFVLKPAGGGATGNNGNRSSEPNPWAKETRNLTKQGEVMKQDRAKAERLMLAAGLSAAEVQNKMRSTLI